MTLQWREDCRWSTTPSSWGQLTAFIPRVTLGRGSFSQSCLTIWYLWIPYGNYGVRFTKTSSPRKCFIARNASMVIAFSLICKNKWDSDLIYFFLLQTGKFVWTTMNCELISKTNSSRCRIRSAIISWPLIPIWLSQDQWLTGTLSALLR